MKERPILFSTSMVQAILEGRKTMTRRVVNPQPSSKAIEIVRTGQWKKEPWAASFPYNTFPERYEVTDTYKCPFGDIGDYLWVRETWNKVNDFPSGDDRFIYKVDYVYKHRPAATEWKWKPSIYMPRTATHIFLQITDIRVERLLEISDNDCINEGIEEQIDPLFPGERLFKFYPNKDLRDETFNTSPKTSFYSLWESIHGNGSWHLNPWVWVIKFRRIDL